MITQKELKTLFDYDENVGVFIRKFSYCRLKAGVPAGYEAKDGYITIRIKYKNYMAHRLAWLWVYGEFPQSILDHINGEKDDNRICNLRLSSPRENCENLKLPTIANKTGYLGVMFDKKRNKFSARIQVNYKQIYLGYFDDAYTAYNAYVEAKRKYHLGCTI